MTGRDWWNAQKKQKRPARAPDKPAPPLPPQTDDKEALIRLAREVEDGWIADEKRKRRR